MDGCENRHEMLWMALTTRHEMLWMAVKTGVAVKTDMECYGWL